MTEKPLNQFALWLDSSMQSRGVSQAQLAREVGVADAQISRWRRGQVRPTLHYLQRLASTFDVPRATLDRLAGYPSPEGASPEDDLETDPERQARREALQSRYGALLEEIPENLWPAFADACEALARELQASFAGAVHAVLEGKSGQTTEDRHIGFRNRHDER